MTTNLYSGTRILVFVLSCAVSVLSGCSRKGDGPVKYTLSGSVTFKGRPVPVGNIMFEPDTAKGNQGPGGIALIKDGKYQTEPGKGVVGGSYLAQFHGYDGIPYEDEEGQENKLGKPLFLPAQLKISFPDADATYDFVLPVAEAGSSASNSDE